MIHVIWDVRPCAAIQVHQTSWRHIPEDSSVRCHRCENLKSFVLSEEFTAHQRNCYDTRIRAPHTRVFLKLFQLLG